MFVEIRYSSIVFVLRHGKAWMEVDWAEETLGYLKNGKFVCYYIMSCAEILTSVTHLEKFICNQPNFLEHTEHKDPKMLKDN